RQPRDRAAPAADRADDRRAGDPGEHRPAQPADRPVGGPRRAGRLGRRGAAGRGTGAAPKGRLMPGVPAAAPRPRSRLRPRRGAAGRGGFGQVLRAEWTKFRTVRGWVIGVIVAPLVTVGLGYLISSSITCSQGPHQCSAPVGPGGESVTDSFYFVHQALRGNGSVTVRVTSLTGTAGPAGPAVGGGVGGQGAAGLQPWSKAGILIKAGTTRGSAYAAMLVTAAHGVRMQYDFTGDTAGLPGAVSPASP